MSEIHKRLRQELEKTRALNAKLADRVRELEAERDTLKNNREDTSKPVDTIR
jgi:BMFP domain-containing protein YqiC